MSAIIHSHTDLADWIQDRLGEGVTRHLAETLAETTWEEARVAGYGPGEDWEPFLAAIDWQGRAADCIAAAIHSKSRRRPE